MAEYQAIETEYNGYRFRSRLEARWAVFFDKMNIRYEYETEGFQLPSGKWYLPDFKLYGFCGRGPEVNGEGEILWCEVKGVSSQDDLEKRKYEDFLKVKEFSNFDTFWTLINMDDSPVKDMESGIDKYCHKIIILPNIPKDAWDWWGPSDGESVTNFSFVDGDYEWPCIITKPDLNDERFVLCGPDGDSFPKGKEISITESSLSQARFARFEFSEQDLGPLEHEVEMLEKRKQLLDRKDELLKQLSGGNKQ